MAEKLEERKYCPHAGARGREVTLDYCENECDLYAKRTRFCLYDRDNKKWKELE
jgi:hypothetical protein